MKFTPMTRREGSYHIYIDVEGKLLISVCDVYIPSSTQ